MLPEKAIESRRHFVFNWRISLFFLVFFPLFIALGTWQYQRGEEKEQLLLTMAEKAQGDALSLYDLDLSQLDSSQHDSDGSDLAGQPVAILGYFDQRAAVLLDNRILKGKVGFEVIQPFLPTNEATWVLVNRGFIPMGTRRSEPVSIPALTDPGSLRGLIYLPSKATYVLDDATETIGDNLVIQAVDFDQLTRYLERPVYPFILRLDSEHSDALPRHWPVTVMQPGKHYGYSLQWSLMAVAILLLYLWVSFPKAATTKGNSNE